MPIWNQNYQAECGSCHDIGAEPSNFQLKHQYHITAASLDCVNVGANPEDLSGKHKKHFIEENIACRNCHNLTQGQNNIIVGPQYHIDGNKTVSFSFARICNYN